MYTGTGYASGGASRPTSGMIGGPGVIGGPLIPGYGEGFGAVASGPQAYRPQPSNPTPVAYSTDYGLLRPSQAQSDAVRIAPGQCIDVLNALQAPPGASLSVCNRTIRNMVTGESRETTPLVYVRQIPQWGLEAINILQRPGAFSDFTPAEIDKVMKWRAYAEQQMPSGGQIVWTR